MPHNKSTPVKLGAGLVRPKMSPKTPRMEASAAGTSVPTTTPQVDPATPVPALEQGDLAKVPLKAQPVIPLRKMRALTPVADPSPLVPTRPPRSAAPGAEA